MRATRITPLVALAAAGLLGVTACSGSSSSPSGPGSSDQLSVVTSFYPLAYLAERVGGDRVSVTDLTAAGVDPHDLELSPKAVAAISDADQVVYLSGFQPAVDTAVSSEAADRAWDVAEAARLTLTYNPVEDGASGNAGVRDPHFWLDPTRYAEAAQALADELGARSPADTATFAANADALTAELRTLDQEWKTATANCASRDLVTTHAAFGYLAERYGFTQVGITLTAEGEPTPQALAVATDFVRRHNVTTIYYEPLASPAVGETVARETGATTAALDPLEGMSEVSAGPDYFAIMRANLAVLAKGQGCT